MGTRLFDEDFLQRLQRLGLIAKRIHAAAGSAGQRKSRRLGDGLEFADHRAYAPGDDLRFLDWPYFARMEKLLLRLFHEHSEGAVSILVDASASMALGEVPKFDYARRAAAALAYVAMASLDRVRLFAFADALGEGMHTGRHRGQIIEVLHYLEGLQAGGPTHPAAAAESFLQRSDSAGTVILISDLLDIQAQLPRALAALRRGRNDLIVLHVVDRQDSDPPAWGPALLEGVEGPARLSARITDGVVEAYKHLWRQFRRDVEKTCLSGRAVYVMAPTDRPFDRLVLEALAKAGVLNA